MYFSGDNFALEGWVGLFWHTADSGCLWSGVARFPKSEGFREVSPQRSLSTGWCLSLELGVLWRDKVSPQVCPVAWLRTLEFWAQCWGFPATLTLCFFVSSKFQSCSLRSLSHLSVNLGFCGAKTSENLMMYLFSLFLQWLWQEVSAKVDLEECPCYRSDWYSFSTTSGIFMCEYFVIGTTGWHGTKLTCWFWHLVGHKENKST